MAGPNGDDIARLEQRRDRLQSELDGIVIDLPALFSSTGVGKRAELAAEIAGIEADIDAYYQRMAERAPPELPTPEPAGAKAEEGAENAAERYLRVLEEQEEAERRAAAARRAAAGEARAKAAAERELGKLDRQDARRILAFLFERVAKLDDPRSIGEALKGSKLGDFWKYRVGDYRLISSIEDGVMRILVVKIGNRRNVYR
mgnify:CR=1 FL=1